MIRPSVVHNLRALFEQHDAAEAELIAMRRQEIDTDDPLVVGAWERHDRLERTIVDALAAATEDEIAEAERA